MGFNKSICCCCLENIVYPEDKGKSYEARYFCRECLKKYDNKPPFKCPCGAEFETYLELEKHRKKMKKAGNPCPRKKVGVTEPCIYCGQPILVNHHSTSKSSEGLETKAEHYKHCQARKDFIAQNGDPVKSERFREIHREILCSGKYIISMLKSKKVEQEAYKYMNYGENVVEQMMWLRTMFKKERIPYELNFCINRCKTIHNGIAELHMLIEFDNEIPKYFTEPLLKEHWCIINLKWTDVILQEDKVIELIKKKIKDQEVLLEIEED